VLRVKEGALLLADLVAHFQEVDAGLLVVVDGKSFL